MNYKLLALITVLLCSFTLFNACSTDSDSGIDEEWRKYNEEIVMNTASSGEYSSRESLSKNGSVYWKYVDDFVPDTKAGLSTKITEDGRPYFTDTVSVRYTGWYLLKDGTKYEFDTTEGERNGVPVLMSLSGTATTSPPIDGFVTMLQYMKVGDQVEVCIPQRLGYGATAQAYIPAYTTLWFRIKLLGIIPSNKGEWD